MKINVHAKSTDWRSGMETGTVDLALELPDEFIKDPEFVKKLTEIMEKSVNLKR